MKIDNDLICQIISSKNKKRKTVNCKCKNRTKIAKLGLKNVKTTNIASKICKIFNLQPDIFPMDALNKNKNKLIDLSVNLSQKINSQIMQFRSVKTYTIIECIAKECVFWCIKHDNEDVEMHINNIYGFNNLYKKEKQILPYLIINELLSWVYGIVNTLDYFATEINVGALQNHFVFCNNYTLARVYGIAKYNQNLLKYINISKKNIKKCVFNFINKLIGYNKKLKLILNLINKITKYTSFAQIRLDM